MNHSYNIDTELWQEAFEAMELIYDFVMESHDRFAQIRDYGNGMMMPMVEIHTLSLINNNPGIVITDVAKMWNRTLGAASQNVNKLVKKGLVIKRKEPGNNKEIHLYPTCAGSELAILHSEYDRKVIEHDIEHLLSKHSVEELRVAVSVLKTGVTLSEHIR